MKKILTFILAAAMTASLAACGSSESDKKDTKENESMVTEAPDTENTSDTEEIIDGGWTVNTEFGKPDIPEEASKAFEKAMEGFAGTAYTPVAYLGSQVVAGQNFKFLCTAVPVTPDGKASLETVTVYNDLEGNASILETAKVNISELISGPESITFEPENLAGGWNSKTACGAPLEGEIKTVFVKALQNVSAYSMFEPLACLATQVVAGTNYAFLFKLSTGEDNAALAVGVIYADLEGNVTMTSVHAFN